MSEKGHVTSGGKRRQVKGSGVRRGGGRNSLWVRPYRGYGSQREAFVMGRVYCQWVRGRLMPSRGVAGATVAVRLGKNCRQVVTDRDGHFRVRLVLESPLPIDVSWHRADIDVNAEGHRPVHIRSEVYVPPQGTDLLVISDIDDTVMFTGVAEKLKMLYRLFVKKAAGRTAFPGVTALYQALHRGRTDRQERPILYVSRGPWAIYDMLEAFFQINRIPVGPILFLRDWGLSWRHPWPRRAEDHKRDLIERMLKLFDDLPCVLIGDSGQHDPEVYTQIVKHHPGRIAAVYIRRVDSDPEREEAIQRLRAELAAQDCSLVLARDSLHIARHAYDNGLISTQGWEAVKRDVQQHPAYRESDAADD